MGIVKEEFERRIAPVFLPDQGFEVQADIAEAWNAQKQFKTNMSFQEWFKKWREIVR